MAPRPSRRFEAVLALLRPADTLVDVGTDHGLLPLFALDQGLARRAIGIDRAAATQAQAIANARAGGLSARAEFRVGDGLAPLGPGEGDALVICGMGGQNALDLLSRGAEKLDRFKQIVIQPNEHAERVRAWALAAGYHLTGEAIVEEARERFQIVAFRRTAPGEGPDPAYVLEGFTPEELTWLGPWLLRAGAPETRARYLAQAERLSRFAAPGPANAALWRRALDWLAARPAGAPPAAAEPR